MRGLWFCISHELAALSPEQVAFLPAAMWMSSTSDIGDGRSHVIALSILMEAAIRPGETVRIWDHHPGTSGAASVTSIIQRMAAGPIAAHCVYVEAGAVRVVLDDGENDRVAKMTNNADKKELVRRFVTSLIASGMDPSDVLEATDEVTRECIVRSIMEK